MGPSRFDEPLKLDDGNFSHALTPEVKKIFENLCGVTSREGAERSVATTGIVPPRKATADRSIPATIDSRLRRYSLRSRVGGVGGYRGGKVITCAINYQLSVRASAPE